MKIEVVHELPVRVRKIGWKKYDVFDTLEEFIDKNEKLGKVVLDSDNEGYCNLEAAYGSINNAISNYRLPLRFERRNGEGYLVRTDMD